MSKKVPSVPESLPAGLKVWVGWSHLVAARNDFDSPAASTAAMEPEAITRPLEKYLAAIHAFVPAVLSPDANDLAISDDDRDRMMNALRDATEDGRLFALLRRFLEVMDAGNRVGRFRMGIPYLPAPDPAQQASPVQHALFRNMVEFAPVKAAFEQSLQCTDELSTDAEWGRILFSALVYGGLLSPQYLMAIPEALARAEPEVRWLLLAPKTLSADTVAPTPQRWLPDPLTRLLLIRLRQLERDAIDSSNGSEYRKVMKLIRAYAKARGFADRIGNGFRSISGPVTTRMSITMPGWLVGYATGRRPSTSLPEWAWDRLISPHARVATELIRRERATEASNAVVENDEDSDGGSSDEFTDESDWPKQLRELGSVILEGDHRLRDRIRTWRKAKAASLLPSVNRVAQWASEYLLGTRRGKRANKYRTVYAKINAGGSRIVGQVGNLDPITLSEDVLLEIYQNALEDTVSIDAQRRVARALQSFHEFLASEAGRLAKELRRESEFPSLADSGIFQVSGKGGAKVDANFISFHVFLLAIAWLSQAARNRYGAERAESLVMIAYLGYFAGLRRSEAVGICIGEVLWGAQEFYILVHKNSLRGVKTKSSHRILPIMHFMPKEFRKRLVALCEIRLRQTNDLSAPMFPEFVRGRQANAKDPALNLITEALQRAANDETLRFHHLRHSFANTMLLMFVLPEIGGVAALPDWFLPTDDDRKRWMTGAAIRDSILGKTRISRRALLQISHLLGHSGTRITLGSYLHISDLILHIYARRLTPALDDITLSALSGITESYVGYFRRGAKPKPSDSGNRYAAILTDLTVRMLNPRRKTRKTERRPRVDIAKVPALDVPRDPAAFVIHVAHALSQGLNHGADPEYLARIFGLEPDLLRQAMNSAKLLPAGMLREHGDPPVKDEPILEMPVGDMQTGMVTSAINAMVRASLDDRGKISHGVMRRMETILSDVTEAWIPDSYLKMRFESLPAAKRWIWFLDQLGFKDGAVALHSPSVGDRLASAQRQLDYWDDLLGLKVKKDEDPPSREAHSGSGKGVVRIVVDLNKVPEGKCNFKKPKGLFGVRFALGLVSVIGLPFLMKLSAV